MYHLVRYGVLLALGVILIILVPPTFLTITLGMLFIAASLINMAYDIIEPYKAVKTMKLVKTNKEALKRIKRAVKSKKK